MVNMNHLMKQAQAMQKKMVEMQEQLGTQEFTGMSGGGAVEVVINGKTELKKVKISPDIVDKNDIEVLEDLIVAAFNDAKRKMEESTQGNMSDMLGGMKLPPGIKFPF